MSVNKPRRGFTLIEVMAAATIFLAIFVALVSGYVHIEHLNAHQRHTTHGIHIGQGMMEELLLLKRDNANLNPGSAFTRVVNKEGAIAAGGLYTVTWETTPNNPISGVNRVDVSVGWTEIQGPRSVTLFTYRN